MNGYLLDTAVVLAAVDNSETLPRAMRAALEEGPAFLYDLPPFHQDPFDRALIAQAIVEELTLVTPDREIVRYASPRLQVIS